jgi:hypothetical protein
VIEEHHHHHIRNLLSRLWLALELLDGEESLAEMQRSFVNVALKATRDLTTLIGDESASISWGEPTIVSSQAS